MGGTSCTAIGADRLCAVCLIRRLINNSLDHVCAEGLITQDHVQMRLGSGIYLNNVACQVPVGYCRH